MSKDLKEQISTSEARKLKEQFNMLICSANESEALMIASMLMRITDRLLKESEAEK